MAVRTSMCWNSLLFLLNGYMWLLHSMDYAAAIVCFCEDSHGFREKML